MLIVKASRSILIILLALCSCKTKKKEIKSINKKGPVAIQYNYSNIQTNSLKDDFDFDLIDTLPVKEGDTVLFRKWGDIDDKPISIREKSKNYRIHNSKYLSYYKTGKTKFSRHRMILKDDVDNTIFNFFFYNNLGEDENPYNRYTIVTSYPKISKLEESKGNFDISEKHMGTFNMVFHIKEKEIYIAKIMEEKSYFSDKAYELDTLIVINKNNNSLNVNKLYEILHTKRNLKK